MRWISEIFGVLCEAACGHRFGPWLPLIGPGRFEQSRCRICRQRMVRPRKLHMRRIVTDRTVS